MNRMQSQFVNQFDQLARQLDQDPQLPFGNLLDASQVVEALDACGVEFRNRVYNPVVTVWAFLSQALARDDASCAKAVTRVQAFRAFHGLKPCSSKTTSYCDARERLPQAVLEHLTRRSAQRQCGNLPAAWLWKGRHVKLLDGSTLSMPDTPANRAHFGLPGGQKAGLGFPQLRMAVLFSLPSGAALDVALGPCRGKGTGEVTLARQVWKSLEPGDVLVADRGFDNYRDIALLRAQGVDVVMGIKSSRGCDFRRGKRLGPGDHLVVWKKPKFDSSRFTREEYNALPDTMLMRELRVRIRDSGGRTRTVTVVTTLTDPQQDPQQDVADLYRERWNCEVDLNLLKTVLHLEPLHCKTPDLVRKEVWAHFLAYNLLREVMAQAARRHGARVRELSFTGALQVVVSFAPYLEVAAPAQRARLLDVMLAAIAQRRVGNRPGRHEPRKKKRRQRKYSYLTKPRNTQKQKIPLTTAA